MFSEETMHTITGVNSIPGADQWNKIVLSDLELHLCYVHIEVSQLN